MHIHNYNKYVTITDIRNFMHSYHGLIQVRMLITGLCSFRTLVGVIELMLITSLCSFRTPVGVIELMLITGLCSFRTPVGVTELMLITGLCSFRTPVGVYKTYTYTTEFTLVRRYP